MSLTIMHLTCLASPSVTPPIPAPRTCETYLSAMRRFLRAAPPVPTPCQLWPERFDDWHDSEDHIAKLARLAWAQSQCSECAALTACQAFREENESVPEGHRTYGVLAGVHVPDERSKSTQYRV